METEVEKISYVVRNVSDTFESNKLNLFLSSFFWIIK